eukprot:1161829-Pelagomonas_calceolata.AAC.8
MTSLDSARLSAGNDVVEPEGRIVKMKDCCKATLCLYARPPRPALHAALALQLWAPLSLGADIS